LKYYITVGIMETTQERIDLVQDYHRRACIPLPNEKLHATLHAIVEAQIALGDETPARRVAQRLIGEGLDRHGAIHAIGMVLAEHIYDVIAVRLMAMLVAETADLT
jgi:hypothetical protein